MASQRQNKRGGFNVFAGINPYDNWASYVDCGDIPVTAIDNKVALKQMTMAFDELLLRRTSQADPSIPPRYVALGGDHSIILPHLRALHKVYGKIAVIHFDAHLDTWSADRPGLWKTFKFTHGTMLWTARKEGLISDNYNVHVGLRSKLGGSTWRDYDEDTAQGWLRFQADEVWVNEAGGIRGIVEKIKNRIPKDYPVYISLDVDCMDPGFTPGTGTIEPGGMAPREVIYMIRNLDLNLVGADVVEVAPAYDQSEITATMAAQVVYEIVTTMVQKGKQIMARR